MGLRLKNGVDLEVLRKYGFKLGKEWAEAGERCMKDDGNEYQWNWYHKFGMESPEKILYIDEDSDIPMVQISIETGEHENSMYVDCTPSCTYHIGGRELDVVLDTIYEMTRDGLLIKS